MIGAAIIIILLGSWLLNLGGQAISTYNVKQEGHRRMQEGKEKSRQMFRKMAEQRNIYYNDECVSVDDRFYRDGSVRFDYQTKRLYPQGRYFYNADGYDCHYNKAPAGAELAPR
jgi:hypothetical protein